MTTTIRVHDIPSHLPAILTALARGQELLLLNDDTPVGRLVPSQPSPGRQELGPDSWEAGFAAWMQRVEARTGEYPPGFQLDDSRDAIYSDRDVPHP